MKGLRLLFSGDAWGLWGSGSLTRFFLCRSPSKILVEVGEAVTGAGCMIWERGVGIRQTLQPADCVEQIAKHLQQTHLDHYEPKPD